MKYVLILCVSLGAVALYLLANASANTAAFAHYYTLLLGLNGLLAACLLALIGYQLWDLRRKLKARVFGSKLTLRLLLMFALMAVLPGMLVYGVSVQFLSKSIESWFDVRVDTALEGGLNLGRSALDNLLRDLTKKGEYMALALTDKPDGDHVTQLNDLREQAGVQEATLFSGRGAIIAFSGSERASMLPDRPLPSLLRQVRQQQPYSAIEAVPEKGLFLRVVVPVNVLGLTESVRVLQLLQPVPARLAKDAETVQAGYRDYQELSVSRLGLKRIYGLTLTLALLLALLSAIALAFVLSARLSAPLSLLAKRTQAIASGDFSEMPAVRSRDELDALMQSFNDMTRQLAEAREVVEFNQRQLETSKAYLESILAHLSSGVLAFDENLRLKTMNPAAADILGVDLSALSGRRLYKWALNDDALKDLAHDVENLFRSGEGKEWQKQMDYPGGSGNPTGNRVLLVRGTRLPAAVGNDYIVVFDDITHLLQAQRDAAWGEVARRLAHEIKNPLTPIQLSAERLEHKLAGKLAPPDTDILQRATQTIVNQVTALKSMVNAFSEYARTPSLNLQGIDLNRLIHEILALYEHSDAHIETRLAPDLPPIVGDPTLLRQVVHNLLQNAQDALAGVDAPQIVVETGVDDSAVRLDIRDNGCGFPEELMARLFEPYVTTKPKGTGLGLAIVKKIIEEHHGRMKVENIQPRGASVSVYLPRGRAV
ncbi:MAG: ATP-binding protein [Sulfuricella sp.]|nr:ATP-binding protein [Sulfuricella sp.]